MIRYLSLALKFFLILVIASSFLACLYIWENQPMQGMDSFAQHIDHAQSLSLGILPVIFSALAFLFFVIGYKLNLEQLAVASFTHEATEFIKEKERCRSTIHNHSPPVR